MHGIRTLLGWALALFLIAILGRTVVTEWFFDLPGDNGMFSTLAARSGYDLFEPTFRVGAACWALVACLLLLFPFFRRLGAFLAFVLAVLLAGLHLSPWLGIAVPLAPGRTATDGGAAFYLTVAVLFGSLLLMAVHPSGRRKDG
jgi:uncharacterized membrane protein YphA (DoxX/SURF4 family)